MQNIISKEYIKKVTQMNSTWLESNGYWYSSRSGKWYQQVYDNKDSIIKDKSVRLFHWEIVTDENALDSLNSGFLPEDLQALADYQHDTMKDQQLGI